MPINQAEILSTGIMAVFVHAQKHVLVHGAEGYSNYVIQQAGDATPGRPTTPQCCAVLRAGRLSFLVSFSVRAFQ